MFVLEYKNQVATQFSLKPRQKKSFEIFFVEEIQVACRFSCMFEKTKIGQPPDYP
jgi:hypothetical protein